MKIYKIALEKSEEKNEPQSDNSPKIPDVYSGDVVNPEYILYNRNNRKSDVLSILEENKDKYLSASDAIRLLSEKAPDRWTTYYLRSQDMAKNFLMSIRDIIKEKGEIIEIYQRKRMFRAKRGGMGSTKKWNEYKLKI